MDYQPAWDASYGRRENHVFVPSDELVRYVSRHIRRRVGLNELVDVEPGSEGAAVLDLGCGIGRHLVYGTEMGLEMHGIDLSAAAVAIAVEWLGRSIGDDARGRVVVGDASTLPWEDAFFAHAVSDSALDSMPFDVAEAAVAELARVVRPGGTVYLNLIASDDGSARDHVVDTEHEHGTVQTYFDEPRIRRLTGLAFTIEQCHLARLEDRLGGTSHGRWHVVLRRR